MTRRHSIKLPVILCCVLLCVGCAPLSSLFSTQPTVNETKYLADYAQLARYSALEADLQRCYGALYTVLTDNFNNDGTVTLAKKQDNTRTTHGVRVSLPVKLTDKAQAQTVFNALLYDHPQFFYVDNSYGLEGYEQNGAARYTAMLLTYTMDTPTRQAAKQQLDSTINSILEKVPVTDDDYITETYIHDTVAALCSYDNEAVTAGFNVKPNAFSAYGALVEGKAVCEGYSRAIQLLLTRCGIPCALALGESIKTGEQHMWNIVTVNGESYHLDATWNDSEDMLRHNYFNVTTDQIALSHRIDDSRTPAISCTATTDNFYHRNGLYIRTYSRQEIAAVIAQRIKAGDTHIELQFEADKFDNALLFLKNATATGEQVNPLLAQSGQQLWPYRLYGETEEHILILRKKQ